MASKPVKEFLDFLTHLLKLQPDILIFLTLIIMCASSSHKETLTCEIKDKLHLFITVFHYLMLKPRQQHLCLRLTVCPPVRRPPVIATNQQTPMHQIHHHGVTAKTWSSPSMLLGRYQTIISSSAHWKCSLSGQMSS